MDGADQTSGSPTGQLPREPLEAPLPHPEPVSRGWLALAGVVAGVAGLALSQAASMALRAESSPVEAVGSAVRDFTPGPIAVFLVHLVKSADKPLLLGGTALVVLVICGYAASWMRRFPLLPDIVFFVLTVIGFLLSVSGVVLRGLAAGRPPWGNMFEFTITAMASRRRSAIVVAATCTAIGSPPNRPWWSSSTVAPSTKPSSISRRSSSGGGRPAAGARPRSSAVMRPRKPTRASPSAMVGIMIIASAS